MKTVTELASAMEALFAKAVTMKPAAFDVIDGHRVVPTAVSFGVELPYPNAEQALLQTLYDDSLRCAQQHPGATLVWRRRPEFKLETNRTKPEYYMGVDPKAADRLKLSCRYGVIPV